MIVEPAQIEEYYQALVDKDSQYVGIYYAGVKTTGIFCISTCRARKPKQENVVFYSSAKEALQHGFRPCKVCQPTATVDNPPEEIQILLKMLADDPDIRIKDYTLRIMGYSPEKVRRWFKQHHQLPFQAYQRMIRLNAAYEQLKNGASITSAALDSGYESLSGFGYSFKKTFQNSPKSKVLDTLIYLHRFTTPLGPMYAAATDQGLCLLEFTDRRMLETEFEDLTRRLKARIVVGQNSIIKEALLQLEAYFSGADLRFDIQLDTPGTDFQKQVWRELQTIPIGQTRSYQEQATAIGNAKAVRAVANANGHNRVSIIIPCHRVIGSDGQLTGYGGGLPRKQWLLDHERHYTMGKIQPF
jgi:AraC family transcriptional regulator of adaptative response/methylated-DNA-[protein]-cysteine methyltransferase